MTQTLTTSPRALRLDTYWPYQIVVLADIISRRTAAIVKEQADLNLSQWRVLAAIAEKPGRTAVEVVQMTPMDKGIVSRATKALLEAGLVRREASQADGRVSHLFLTGPGQALYSRLLPPVEEISSEARKLLGDDTEIAFSETLQELKDRFDLA